MMVNRDRYLIVKNVLKLLSEGDRTPSRIMFGCRLSNNQRYVYLDSMLEKGLIKQRAEMRKNTYAITQKGLDVLDVLRELYNLCPFILDVGLNERMDSYQLI